MTDQAQISLPRLPDVDVLDPVGPQDDACINEIREVLVRHNSLQRFGITLLHHHFDIDDDEVLVESVDSKNRTLTMQPQKVDKDVRGFSIETSWRLDSPTAQRRCEVLCSPITDSEGNKLDHDRNHYQTS